MNEPEAVEAFVETHPPATEVWGTIREKQAGRLVVQLNDSGLLATLQERELAESNDERELQMRYASVGDELRCMVYRASPSSGLLELTKLVHPTKIEIEIAARHEAWSSFRNTAKCGTIVRGTITDQTGGDFVVAVDEEVSGRLPSEELSWDSATTPTLRVGQSLDLMVYTLEHQSLVLSLRRVTPRPRTSLDWHSDALKEARTLGEDATPAQAEAFRRELLTDLRGAGLDVRGIDPAAPSDPDPRPEIIWLIHHDEAETHTHIVAIEASKLDETDLEALDWVNPYVVNTTGAHEGCAPERAWAIARVLAMAGSDGAPDRFSWAVSDDPRAPTLDELERAHARVGAVVIFADLRAYDPANFGTRVTKVRTVTRYAGD